MKRAQRLSEAHAKVVELHEKLVELSRPERLTGGLEVASLLEAWGFVRGKRLDGEEPEPALFYFHPTYRHLHMSIPVGAPLCHYVVDYAGQLIRQLEASEPQGEADA